MKTIIYTVKVTSINTKGETVEIETIAESASDLLKKLTDVFNEKSKYNILNILKLK